MNVTKQKGREFSPLLNFMTSEFLLNYTLPANRGLFLASLLACIHEAVQQFTDKLMYIRKYKWLKSFF